MFLCWTVASFRQKVLRIKHSQKRPWLRHIWANNDTKYGYVKHLLDFYTTMC